MWASVDDERKRGAILSLYLFVGWCNDLACLQVQIIIALFMDLAHSLFALFAIEHLGATPARALNTQKQVFPIDKILHVAGRSELIVCNHCGQLSLRIDLHCEALFADHTVVSIPPRFRI